MSHWPFLLKHLSYSSAPIPSTVVRIRNDETTMASGFDLRVIDVAGRKHLPIVELKKAA